MKSINNRFLALLLATFLAITLSECTFDQIPPEPAFIWVPDTTTNDSTDTCTSDTCTIDTTKVLTVSFMDDVVPIFSDANCLGCHSGANDPNLTPANAYNSLMGTPGKYIDLNNPPNSLLVTILDDSPINMGSFTANELNTIFTWISEGANNN